LKLLSNGNMVLHDRFWLCCRYTLKERLGTRFNPRSQKIWNFFFLLKFNMVCMFWIVLMCWYQK
jgi:hypothetical protein